ncbi:MAG: acyltransferase [Clostridiales bacterium]|nr:acyltransferase [Clostridiales bacterium]
MSRRLRDMDFIRAVAALAVIAIHVSAAYVKVSRGAYYTNQLVRFAVPLFVLISGLLLFRTNDTVSDFKGYLAFLGKRLRKIFIPYILWSIIYILFSIRSDFSRIWLSPGDFFPMAGKKLLIGTANSHLYFVIIIIQLYLLFPLLKAFVKRFPKTAFWSTLLVTLASQVGIYLHSMRIITLQDYILPKYEVFPVWIFFFVFGMLYSANIEKWQKRLEGMLPQVFLIWVACLALLIIDNRVTGTLDLSIKPSIMLYCIATFLLLEAVALQLRERIQPLWIAADWLSLHSFFIYLAHILFMACIRIVTNRLGLTHIWDGFGGMLLLYVSVTAVTAAAAYITSRIPVISPLLGGSRSSQS